MIDEPTAVELAREFLKGRAGADGPFRVIAEQDHWIVCAPSETGGTIMVHIDVDDGVPSYLTGRGVDVDLRKGR